MLEGYMLRLKQGDSSALADIYKNTRKAVFAVCYTMVRDYSLAQDMMQDTYLRVDKYINRYKEQYKAKAWILRIARNLCLNEINRRKREIASPSAIDKRQKYEELKAYDESGIIAQVVKNLNQNESKIVLMHTLGDISLKEIAQLTGRPSATIRWQYNNALKKLRKRIRQEDVL